MSTTLCTCDSLGRTDLRQCPDHFHLWRADKRLTSVGRIIHASFPMDPTIPAAVLENARERGSEVDALFSKYVIGNLRAIPAGTRQDSLALFEKLQNWYDRQNIGLALSQVLLGDTDHGGIVDLIFDSVPVDLKCTYNVETAHRLQTAAYSDLHGENHSSYVLHVTERFKEPRIVPLEQQDYDDWRTMLAHWRMTQRRTA